MKYIRTIAIFLSIITGENLLAQGTTANADAQLMHLLKLKVVMCGSAISDAQETIKREKKISAISGYEDTKKLHDAGSTIVECQEALQSFESLGGEAALNRYEHQAKQQEAQQTIQKAEKEVHLQTLNTRKSEEIQSSFSREAPAFYAIFNRAVRENHNIGAGKIVVSLTIAPDGLVTDCQLVSSTFADSALEAKVIQRVKLMHFSAKDVQVFTYPNFPIIFSPS